MFKPGSSNPESRRGLPLGWAQNDSAPVGLGLDGGCQTREMRTVAFLEGRAGLEPASSSFANEVLYPLSYRPSRRRGSRRQGRRHLTRGECKLVVFANEVPYRGPREISALSLSRGCGGELANGHGVRGDVARHVGCNDDEFAFAGFVRAGGNEHELRTSANVSSSERISSA